MAQERAEKKAALGKSATERIAAQERAASEGDPAAAGPSSEGAAPAAGKSVTARMIERVAAPDRQEKVQCNFGFSPTPLALLTFFPM